jgi:hypothetical protein
VCVTASGIVGATVAKVDNGMARLVYLFAPCDSFYFVFLSATSTALILGGKIPLYSKRVKGGVIRGMKSEQFPHGLDETGKYLR